MKSIKADRIKCGVFKGTSRSRVDNQQTQPTHCIKANKNKPAPRKWTASTLTTAQPILTSLHCKNQVEELSWLYRYLN